MCRVPENIILAGTSKTRLSRQQTRDGFARSFWFSKVVANIIVVTFCIFGTPKTSLGTEASFAIEIELAAGNFTAIHTVPVLAPDRVPSKLGITIGILFVRTRVLGNVAGIVLCLSFDHQHGQPTNNKPTACSFLLTSDHGFSSLRRRSCLDLMLLLLLLVLPLVLL